MSALRGWPAIPVIIALVGSLYAACFVVSLVLGWPWDLDLPWFLRILGLPLIGYGVGMGAWALRFRGARTVLESTWATFQKLVGWLPIETTAGRTEPLVVAGPYRVARHPLYSGVDGLVFGIAILVDHPWTYLGALAVALWFALVLAPFEERELRALFGPDYATYARSVRRFLPIPRTPR